MLSFIFYFNYVNLSLLEFVQFLYYLISSIPLHSYLLHSIIFLLQQATFILF